MKSLFNSMMTTILPLLVLISILALSSPAFADSSVVTRAYDEVSIMICPGCDNEECNAGWLYNAQLFGGEYVDATIEFYTDDYPLNSEMWVMSPNITFCPGENDADDVPVNGHREITRLRGGGVSTFPSLEGFIAGNLVPPTPIPHIRINSPDLTGDGSVTLHDVQLFAQYYFGPYNYGIDYYWDGVINLLDVVVLVEHYRHGFYRQ